MKFVKDTWDQDCCLDNKNFDTTTCHYLESSVSEVSIESDP